IVDSKGKPTDIAASGAGNYPLSTSHYPLSLHLLRNLLHVTKDPQQIAAENFIKIGGGITALVQSLRDLWQIGGRVQPLRRAVDAVEVRAQPDMVHAGHLDHVVDVVDQVAERRPRQLGRKPRLGLD